MDVKVVTCTHTPFLGQVCITVSKPFYWCAIALECYATSHSSVVADEALEMGTGLDDHVGLYTFPGGAVLSTGLQNQKEGMFKHDTSLPFTNAPAITRNDTDSLAVRPGYTCSLIEANTQ